MVLSSPFTSGGPGSSPARSTNGLGFQSLPDSVGFAQNTISGVFLPSLKTPTLRLSRQVSSGLPATVLRALFRNPWFHYQKYK